MGHTMFAGILAVLLLVTTAATAEPLDVLSWNIESGGSDPAIIAKQLQELPGFDAYCFQEVRAKDAGRYAAAIRKQHGKAYKYVLGSFGGGDRLMIVFDESRFTLLDVRELFQVGEYRLNDWNHRPPLVLHLKDKSNGVEFYLLTVHLARKNAKLRMEQAKGLQEWARDLKQPAIAIGDFNFDYNFGADVAEADELNKAGQQFVADDGNRWQWVAPAIPKDTNWSDRNRDGVDDYPDSMLDLSFIAVPGPLAAREALVHPSGWIPSTDADVIVRDGDFPDTKATSDHRPVTLSLDWVRVPK